MHLPYVQCWKSDVRLPSTLPRHSRALLLLGSMSCRSGTRSRASGYRFSSRGNEVQDTVGEGCRASCALSEEENCANTRVGTSEREGGRTLFGKGGLREGSALPTFQKLPTEARDELQGHSRVGWGCLARRMRFCVSPIINGVGSDQNYFASHCVEWEWYHLTQRWEGNSTTCLFLHGVGMGQEPEVTGTA